MEQLFGSDARWYGSQVSLNTLPPAFDRPAYTLAEAARYARTATTTARQWVFGRNYPTAGGERRSAPVAARRPADVPFLTFHDLVEVAAIARAKEEGVKLPAIRAAIEYAKEYFGVERPLLLEKFMTDGESLYLTEAALNINASRAGQLAFPYIREVLRHLDYEDGQPSRWWPDGKGGDILVDPRVSFGYPVIASTGLRTSEVIDRFQAGEDVAEIADEYHVPPGVIQAAMRFENRVGLIPA